MDRAGLLDSVIAGLLATKLIESPNDVASVWMHSACYGYPTPFLGRDRLVEPILAELENVNIYSRGRFGGWKYEVSNQDHSLDAGRRADKSSGLRDPGSDLLVPGGCQWEPALIGR